MARSIKAQLYLYIKTLLLGGTYTDILDVPEVLTGLDFIKHVNFWNSELLNPETKDNYPVPAVFFEFSNTEENTIQLKTNETSDLETTKDNVEFTLHLISSKLSTENKDFDYLDMVDNADLIFRKLQAKNTAGIKDIKKIREPMDINNTVLMDYKIVFTAILTNCGSSEQVDSNDPTINPEAPVAIELNIGIAPNVPTPPIIPPFDDNLDTWNKTINNNIFAEGVNNLPAKFMPRVGDFNGVNDYVDTGVQLNGNSFDISVSGKKSSGVFFGMVQGHSVERTGLTWHSNNSVFGFVSTGLGITFGVTPVLTNFDFKTLRLVYDGTLVGNANRLKLYIDGVYTAFNSFTGTIPSTITASATNLRIGEGYNGAQYSSGIMSNVQSLNQFEYNLTGQGAYDYDVSGNNNHGTWSGTGTRFDYEKNGSTYPNANGYSLWQKAANPDIQVPFDINGLPLILTAGVDIPTGYTKTRDIAAGGDKWNMSDALIDFDFDKLENTQIAIYDRSNTARQTAASRASLFYDAANPYRYKINEIADPRIYDTFFEAGFKNRVFGKVVLSGTDLIRLDEQLNYSNQKNNNPLALVQDYCNITNIYP